MTGYGAGTDEAWIRGEFQASVDAPEVRPLWPADYRIAVTYRLAAGRLRLEARVQNPDPVLLPFGLGYHPYFRVPPLPGGRAADCWVEVWARSYWELQENLPTGERRPLDAARDLTQPRRFSDLVLDDVLTDLEPGTVSAGEGLVPQAVLRQLPEGVAVHLLTSPGFRELVVFTPPHRLAVCLEPYTCTTDAINLQPRGIDAGLLVLEPRQEWSGVVELRCAAP